MLCKKWCQALAACSRCAGSSEKIILMTCYVCMLHREQITKAGGYVVLEVLQR